MLIVLIFDYSEKVNDFIKHDLSVWFVLKNYYVYVLVFFAYILTPIFSFLSTIYVTSRLTLKNELLSIFCGGINYYRVLKIYMTFCLLLGITSFLVGNFVIPPSNKKKIEFECKYVTRCTIGTTANIHKRYEKGKYIYFSWFNFDKKEGKDVTLESFEDGKMVEKTYIKSAKWDSGNVWKMNNYFKRDLANNTIKKGYQFDTIIQLSADELRLSPLDAPMFNYYELEERIENEKLKGGKGLVYLEIEKLSRILGGVVIFILVSLGFAVSGRKKRGGIGVDIALGTFIAFSFLFFHRIANVLAVKSSYSPYVTLTSLVVFYSIVSLFMLLKAQK